MSLVTDRTMPMADLFGAETADLERAVVSAPDGAAMAEAADRPPLPRLSRPGASK